MTQTASPPETQVVIKKVSGALTFQQDASILLLATHKGDFFVSPGEVNEDLDWDAWFAGKVEFGATATVELVHPTLKGSELQEDEWAASPIADRVPDEPRVDGVVLPGTLKLKVHWIDYSGQPENIPNPKVPPLVPTPRREGLAKNSETARDALPDQTNQKKASQKLSQKKSQTHLKTNAMKTGTRKVKTSAVMYSWNTCRCDSRRSSRLMPLSNFCTSTNTVSTANRS